jgi:undecaprenyl diphosphate synthase
MRRASEDGIHVAIIMDGNGRWATQRKLPREAGHRKGADSVRAVTETAPELGVRTLTLYAFSSDNWKRPRREVSALMRLFRVYMIGELDRCLKNGVRISFIGRRDRLSPSLVELMEHAEMATAKCERLHMRIAIDYSSRDQILAAAERLRKLPEVTRESFAFALRGTAPDVDLLIRTGGEQRLSDFLLWESAYAELYFTPCMWPEFGRDELAGAVEWYQARERRFGAVPQAAAV